MLQVPVDTEMVVQVTVYSDVLVVPGVEVTTTCWSMVVLPMLVVKTTAVIIA